MSRFQRLLRKLGFLFIIYLLVFPLMPVVAEGPSSVYDMIQGGNEGSDPVQSNSEYGQADQDESNSLTYIIVKFVLSFVLIVLLIYLFLKFVAARTRSLQTKGPFKIIGGATFGSNRSLQMVLVGDTVYILGVGENVRLVRSISKEEPEFDVIMNRLSEQADFVRSFNFKRWFKKGDQENQTSDTWNEIFSDKLSEMKKDRKKVESWLEYPEEDDEGKHSR